MAAQPTDGYAGFDVAPNGTFAFLRASDWFVDRRVVWLDHAGREEPVPAIPRAGAFAEPRLSPDGRWIAITVTSPKHEVWLYERARGVLTQLSHAPAAAFNAVWTPDSRSVIYCFEDPMFDLHRLTIDASVPDRAVVTSYFDKFASSVSPDGRQVALTEDTHTDRILLAPLDGGAPPKLLGEAGVSQRLAVFSPDGRWIAYEQETSGRNNVYVRSASGAGGPRPVSGDGGTEPRWTRGGTRDRLSAAARLMMAAPVAPATGEVGSPSVLFRVPSLIRLGGSRTHSYDVTPDGQSLPDRKARGAGRRPAYGRGAQLVLGVEAQGRALDGIPAHLGLSRRTRHGRHAAGEDGTPNSQTGVSGTSPLPSSSMR